MKYSQSLAFIQTPESLQLTPFGGRGFSSFELNAIPVPCCFKAAPSRLGWEHPRPRRHWGKGERSESLLFTPDLPTSLRHFHWRSQLQMLGLAFRAILISMKPHCWENGPPMTSWWSFAAKSLVHILLYQKPCIYRILAFFLHIINLSALLNCPDFWQGVVFNACFYMRSDFLMDICIRTLRHDIYVYIISTVSPVALLGLHEIVGWCFLLKKKKYFHSAQSAGTVSPSLPSFSPAAKESLILISFTAERLWRERERGREALK